MRLTDPDATKLRDLQRQTHEKRAYVKITTLLMLHLGDSPERISASLGISVTTIDRYESVYLSEGLEVYLADSYSGYWGKLTSAQLAALTTELRARLYRTSADIATYIERTFGVCYTPKGLTALLHRLGFSYKKTKSVPCAADLAKQVEYLQVFKKLMVELPAGDVVYFLDAVHPQHNTRPAYGWIPTGEEKEIPANSGRRRLNLNGALNAADVTDVVVVESASVNADSTWELYQKLAAKHPDAPNIHVICDNAAYYKSGALKEKLENSRIHQIFLPPYSPNLNLIERLWKFLRKKAIDLCFNRHFDDFRKNILHFFENIHLYKEELKTLLTLNFHLPKLQTNLP